MKQIEIWVGLTDDLCISSVTIGHNDTELNRDSELIKLLAIGLLKAVKANKDDLMIQDLLNELDIKTAK